MEFAAGRSIGNTGADGEQIKDRPVLVPDLLATIIKGLGIDPAKQNTVEQRPADPAGRSQGQADQGSARMTGTAAFLVLALAAAQSHSMRHRRIDDGARQLIFLAENRPVFVACG